ncbi:MAG: hypothetical protein PHI44_03590 [Candidatus Ratteibacteria bacterium]|nr:hypothetical protein [Candidatus Ratteibacteria bacterium]
MDKIKIIMGMCICSILLCSVSCSRKKKVEEELTPLNAVEKYGGVMGTAMKKSKAMDDILYLKDRINTFHIQEGRYPSSLSELVEKKYIEKLPEPPKGMSFMYDPSTGNVNVQ